MCGERGPAPGAFRVIAVGAEEQHLAFAVRVDGAGQLGGEAFRHARLQTARPTVMSAVTKLDPLFGSAGAVHPGPPVHDHRSERVRPAPVSRPARPGDPEPPLRSGSSGPPATGRPRAAEPRVRSPMRSERLPTGPSESSVRAKPPGRQAARPLSRRTESRRAVSR